MQEGFFKRLVKYQASKVAGILLAFSIIWIIVSDQVASYLYEYGELKQIQTIKGILFVCVTSLVVFMLVFRYEKKNKKLLRELSNTLNDLEGKVKERTQALNESLTNEKEVVESQKRFISTASHEFRTPLTTIFVYVWFYQTIFQPPI
jgi:signal transduction histidine kinase